MARCLETIDISIWHMFVFVCCSDCVGVCGNVCSVVEVIKDSVFLALECESMYYVCVRVFCFLFVF